MSMDSPIEETTSFSATKKSSLFSSPLHLPAIWTRTNANAEGPTPTIKETALRKPTIRFPCEGLKVSALANFVAVCGGEKKIKHLTTQQIVEKCILPVTAANKSSYCELIKARDPSVVCHATAYISHSWGANFMDTYRAIRYHFRNSPDATLWIDIFCLDQRIFYPKRIRKGKCAAFGDAADLLSTSVGAGASEQASFFSPFRMTFGHNTGDHSRGAESPGASSTGGVSVMSTNSAANHEYDGMEPTAAVGAQNAKVSTTYQWNGLHTGMAGDWCADILKHGIDQIGHVVLIVNPNPNPEPKSGDQGDMGKAGSGKGVVEGGVAATATAAATEAEAAGAGVEQYDQPAENALLWDKSRYVNPKHALNRLWCLYEVYCTTVDRSHTPVVAAVARAHSPAAAEALASGEGVGVNANFSPRVASRGNENSQVVASAAAGAGPKRGGGGSGGTKKACTFDIAMHYSILSDGQHGSSANVKNKRNPFTIDLQVTCRDFEHLMKWVCAVKLESCAASDVADAERLLHIINVDVGATIFIDTVRNVLSSWIVKSMNENSHEIGNLDARNATATYTNTLLNTSTNKSRLYIQRCLCNLFHVKGDTFRAEGSLIELSKPHYSFINS